MKKILLLLLLPFTLLAQKEVVIHIGTDSYASETKWVLYKDVFEGDTIAHVPYGHYTQSNTMNSDTIYMADSITDISFVIYDSYGDGIINGSYYVTICGDTVVDYPASTFTTGLIHNRVVPQCMPNPPPSQGSCNDAIIKINLDQYPSETSWDIKDSLGSVIFAHGSYAGVPGYQPQQYNKCLPLGELTFTIYDTYGDGMAGSLWGGSDGSYYIIQCGDTLVYGNVANFGTDSTHAFISDTCIPPSPIFGCMDENYLEFDPAANANDSSYCATLKILGCTDTTMFNYDTLANYSDYVDSCLYTLVLNDLLGNGWVGSTLQVIQDDTLEFSLGSGFTDTLYIYLESPAFVEVRFEILAQASATATECGFSLMGPLGDVIVNKPIGFIIPFTCYPGYTNCGNSCEEKLVGCMDSLAFNYVPEANIDTFCYYNPGCISPAYLEYHADTTMGIYTDFHIQDSCINLATFGCMDSTAFDYDSLANVNTGCISIVMGCMQPLAFNYNPLANTPDTCTPLIYGCIDPTMFNYCSTCNTDDGDCDPYIFGCTDSTMFNYNPLANADNNSCTPFIYGCTNPSMLNYNALANTEDFTCVPYIYGCMDSTALNYDSLANTDNESCITIVEGCMDQSAYNYNSFANVSDSLSCLFDAGCITGPGNPYWLNDPCYAWVIDIDDYCCNNAWDIDCQSLYNYCEDGWTGPTFLHEFRDQLIVYPNPAINKININKFVDIRVYNVIGDMIISENNVNVLDVSKIKSGMYNLQIMYKNKLINKRIIKQ